MYVSQTILRLPLPSCFASSTTASVTVTYAAAVIGLRSLGARDQGLNALPRPLLQRLWLFCRLEWYKPLHVATRIGNVAAVQAITEWGKAHGIPAEPAEAVPLLGSAVHHAMSLRVCTYTLRANRVFNHLYAACMDRF